MPTTFHDLLLSKNYSALATGGAEFATAEIRSGVGGAVSHRNVNREDYISRYSIPYKTLTSSQLSDLRKFHLLRKGRGYGFRFYPPDDHTLTTELAGKLNVSTGEVEQMTTTDGSTTAYYFGKYYSDAGAAYYRRLVKPSPIEAGTFLVTDGSDSTIESVAFGGIPDAFGIVADSEVIATSSFGNVTIDYTQGKITLTSASASKKIKLTCTYHIPAVFEDDHFNAEFGIGENNLSLNIVELLPVELGIT